MSSEGLPQRLYVNVFGIQLDPRIIYRHIVHIKLVDPKNRKDHILTTLSSRGRGNRLSKIRDNFIIIDEVLRKIKKNAKTIFAYDGAGVLFAVEPINVKGVFTMDEALLLENLSTFLKDSVKFLSGSIEAFVEVDIEQPSFDQTDTSEWMENRFNVYLDIVTAQAAIRSGKYLPHSRGLMVHTGIKEPMRGNWAYGAKGIHKGCRVVGDVHPLPIIEMDPQDTHYFAELTVDELLRRAFPRVFSDTVNMKFFNIETRKISILIKDLKCNPFYADRNDYGTNSIIISGLDYNAIRDPQFRNQFPNIKYSNYPAAVYGMQKKKFPLEYLKILPYQTLDKRVLEEFDMIPKAKAPSQRWDLMTKHFEEFAFDDNVYLKKFGIEVCNNPVTNISELQAERVAAPQVRYSNPVSVNDEKRDWKSDNARFAVPANIGHLVVCLVVLNTREFNADIERANLVVNTFIEKCRMKGMQIGGTDFRSLPGAAQADVFLREVFRSILHAPEPFVLLISDDVPEIHECLKFEERMSDIPTQHILLKNMRGIADKLKMRRVALPLENIILKTNVKCGGINYTAEVPQEFQSWCDNSTFIVGIDVAHPDRLAAREGHPSTVGLSCNSAENAFSFVGDFSYTAPHKEMVDDEILDTFISRNVERFAQHRGFPKKILVFRDGVSFGEEADAKREVEIIENSVMNKAAENGHTNYKPSVVAIVVKKRHHTRFYMSRDNQPVNPLPDTAVGGMIAEYGKRQLFIQAFRPVQGTAKVPSFVVIRDDDDIPDENLTQVVCAICSLHQIVNSPTSIPTPVFVAHELAKRGTDLYKALRSKNSTNHTGDWKMLTVLLSYSETSRLSKMRIV